MSPASSALAGGFFTSEHLGCVLDKNPTPGPSSTDLPLEIIKAKKNQMDYLLEHLHCTQPTLRTLQLEDSFHLAGPILISSQMRKPRLAHPGLKSPRAWLVEPCSLPPAPAASPGLEIIRYGLG